MCPVCTGQTTELSLHAGDSDPRPGHFITQGARNLSHLCAGLKLIPHARHMGGIKGKKKFTKSLFDKQSRGSDFL